MKCIKTGGQLYLATYNLYAWCAMFETNGVLVARIVGVSAEPINGCTVIHGTVLNADNWFDRREHISTLVTSDWLNHGYEGSEII